MKSKKARARYYVLYVQDGKYLYWSVEDIYEAQQELNYLINSGTNDVTALGIYDPQDWHFDWVLNEPFQQEHMEPVLILIEELRKQWDK